MRTSKSEVVVEQVNSSWLVFVIEGERLQTFRCQSEQLAKSLASLFTRANERMARAA